MIERPRIAAEKGGRRHVTAGPEFSFQFLVGGGTRQADGARSAGFGSIEAFSLQ